eukprot:4578069-Amphidinium_carterae.1
MECTFVGLSSVACETTAVWSPCMHQSRDASTMSSFGELPKVIAFDLDGTLWSPEMYELWGRGGAPFTATDNGQRVYDRSGTEVQLLGMTRTLLEELSATEVVQGGGCTLAIASSCDEPNWARECMRLFRFTSGKRTMNELLPVQEIYKAPSKAVHFKRIQEKTGAEFEDMIFLDNQMDNIEAVRRLGVHCIYTPDGVTPEAWTAGLKQWQQKRSKKSKREPVPNRCTMEWHFCGSDMSHGPSSTLLTYLALVAFFLTVVYMTGRFKCNAIPVFQII